MSYKLNDIIASLIIVLMFVLYIQPKMIYNIYENTFGRIILILFVVYLAKYSIILGLLACLLIISSIFEWNTLTEGIRTIGEDNDLNISDNINRQIVLTKLASKSNNNTPKKDGSDNIDFLKKYSEQLGIDKEDIKLAIASVNSNSIPVNKNANKSSENVKPYSKMF